MIKAEQFCKLNGVCWHDYTGEDEFECRICHESLFLTKDNPTFTDAKSILEVMMKRDDWYVENWKEPQGFLWKIGTRDIGTGPIMIYLNYILDPDKLLDEAIRFCEKNKT